MNADKHTNPLSRLVGLAGTDATPPRPAPFTTRNAQDDDMESAGAGGVTHGADGDGSDEDQRAAHDSFSNAANTTSDTTRSGRRGGARTARKAVRSARRTAPPSGDARHDDDDFIGAKGGKAERASAVGVPADHHGNDDDRERHNANAAVLETIAPAIEKAQTFAERWPAPYRAEIFRVSLGQLLGTWDVGEGHRIGHAARVVRSASVETGGVSGTLSDHRPAGGPLAPIEKLARALNIDVDAVERSVHIDNDGRVSFLGRLEGRGKKELQTRYSLAYLYVKEMALGNRMVDIVELRSLCVDQGCYDQGNFTGNFRKDVDAGLIREDGTKGSRTRRYMLSQKGVAEGASLLRGMAEQ